MPFLVLIALVLAVAEVLYTPAPTMVAEKEWRTAEATCVDAGGIAGLTVSAPPNNSDEREAQVQCSNGARFEFHPDEWKARVDHEVRALIAAEKSGNQ